MRSKSIITAVFLFCFVILSGSCFAEGFTFHANAGLSQLTGDVGDVWNTGFSIRGYGYNNLTPRVLLGLGMDVNWYSLDETAVVSGYTEPGLDWNNSGDMFFIEIGPSVRVLDSADESKNIHFFGEAGLSFFRMSQSGTVQATYWGYTATEPFTDSKNQMGISVGGGMIIGSGKNVKFEVLPMIHLPFDDDIYFTLTGGIIFGN